MKFFFKKMIGVYVLGTERKASGEGEIKDLREGGGMNWQEARADGKYEVEPVDLVSERRRPILLVMASCARGSDAHLAGAWKRGCE